MRRLRAGLVTLIVLALMACGEADSSAESLEFADSIDGRAGDGHGYQHAHAHGRA